MARRARDGAGRQLRGSEGPKAIAAELSGPQQSWEAVAGRPTTRPTEDDVGELGGVSSFPPIADYAFLSDCEVTALIAPSGNVEWLCLPRMDGPSVFGAVLDRDAGGVRVGPAGVHPPAARPYLPGPVALSALLGQPDRWGDHP